MYLYQIKEIILVETIANALDAGAETNVFKLILSLLENGTNTREDINAALQQ